MSSLAAMLLLTAALQSPLSDRTHAEDLARAGRTAEPMDLFRHIVDQNPADIEARLSSRFARSGAAGDGGCLQVLWRHRRAIANPRLGVVGMGVLPYTTFFEGVGPLLEMAGYVITAVAAILGVINWGHFRVLLAVSLLFGAATTLVAVFLSDLGTGRYLRIRDLGILLAAAVVENFGYRQLNA